MKLRKMWLVIGLTTLTGLAAAGEAVPSPSLYQRLGGAVRVAAIVDSTLEQLAANREAQDDKKELVRRICAVSGGGCRYRGSNDTGTELVEALRVAMRTHGVPLAARNELLEALAPTRRAGATLALNPRK